MENLNDMQLDTNPDEEISLIDLFAVLLRYRKMIIIGTLLMTFITAVVLVVIPKLTDIRKTENIKVMYSVSVNQMPSSFRYRVLENSGMGGVGDYLSSTVKYLPFLASEYKKYPFFEKDGKLSEEITDEQFNQMVSGFIDSKNNEMSKIKIEKSVIADTYDISFEILPDNKEVADEFVKDVVVLVDDNISKVILPRVDDVLSDVVSSISNIQNSFSALSDAGTYQNLEQMRQDIEKFKREFAANPHFVQLKSDVPFSYTVKKISKSKSLFICFFASLFLFVFVAFARNAIENIKKDSVASKTISDAWNAGR